MIDVKKMIAELEKGYSNKKSDRGGPTKYGVTLGTLKQYYSNPNLTEEDVKALTMEEAEALYHEMFIKQPRLSELPPCLQQITFDMCVNHGPVQGVKLLQRALRAYLKDSPSIDGLVGAKTIRAAEMVLEAHGARAVIETLVAVRVEFYKDIVANDATQKVNLAGWLNRAESFLTTVKTEKV